MPTTAYTVSPEEIAHYHEHGYVVLDDVLEPEQIAALLDRSDGMLEGRYPSEGFKCGRASDRGPDDPGRLIKQIAPREYPPNDPVFGTYGKNPTLLEIVRQLMGVDDAIVFQQQVLVKEPGAANGTPWHQDNHYWRHDDRPACTAWAPLLPTSAQDGTMWLIPDTHKGRLLHHDRADGVSDFRAIQEAVDESQAIPLELKPGQVSFHDKMLVHGAKPNNGQNRRVAIAQHYRQA